MTSTQRAITQPLIERLGRHTRLEPVEVAALRELGGSLIAIRHRTDFVRLGDQSNDAHFILSGLVGRFDQNRKAKRQVVALYFSGDIPDLHAVGIPGAASALHAFSATNVIRFSRTALGDAAARHVGLALAFWRESALDAIRVSKRVVNLGRKDALSGMAHLLCEYACRSADTTVASAVNLDFPLTQQNLGDVLGLSPVHINRIMMSLSHEQIVAHDRGRVSILDWERLSTLADFDPSYLNFEPANNQIVRPYNMGWGAAVPAVSQVGGMLN